MRLHVGIVAMLLATLSGGVRVAVAQSVTGTIVDTRQRAVAGVVVELLDSAMTSVAHSVSTGSGAFTVRTMRAGRYQVRARQVGFKPVLSPPMMLTAGAASSLTLAFEPLAFALDTVRVGSRAVCGRASDSTLSVVAALEYARTALLSTDVARARGVTSTSMRYERLLDPIRERVQRQSLQAVADSTAQPWTSLPVGTIRTLGYVITVGDSVEYKLPGLDMLASSAFVDDHCFKFNGKSDAKRIGVMFEPTASRKKLGEIQGTLWLDRKTAQLQSLEFRYANLEGAQDDAKPGGAMSFTRLPDGTFVVNEWSVRMPVLEQRMRVSTGVPGTVVAGIRVEGGQLVSVAARIAATAQIDTLWARELLTVSGEVIDSLSSRPVNNAIVGLAGTTLSVATDSAGKFTMRGVLAGEYTVYVRTPSLDSVRASNTYPVLVTTSIAGAQLKAANAQTIVALLCPAGRAGADRGVVFGQLAGDTSAFAGDARVVIEWAANDGGALQWIAARANTDGSFRACGVPIDRAITLRASTSRAAAEPVVVNVASGTRFASALLTLDVARSASAVLTGIVVGDSTMTPVAGAEISLPQLSRTVRTNAEGRFRISDLPPGQTRVLVRRLGFGPLDAQLTFASHATIDRRIVLGKITVIDSVVVRADFVDPAMREFDERRKMGIGRFLTRADLDKFGGLRLEEGLQAMTGTAVLRNGSNSYVISTRKRTSKWPGFNRPELCYYFEGKMPSICHLSNECYMQVWVDNVPLFRGRNLETIPDVSRYPLSQLEAIEVFNSPAETPSRYSSEKLECGVIVLHIRRKL